MHALLVALGVVFLSEFGDKTQMLALLLASRFRRVVPIALGCLCATGINHLLVTWLGASVAERLGTGWLRWGVGAMLVAMAAVMLLPDRSGKAEFHILDRLGPFGATLAAYFVAEMGDKTQLATMTLAARYDSVTAVALGSTVGIMLADIPAIFLGGALSRRLDLRWARMAVAAIFLILGVAVLAGSSLPF